MIVIDVEEKHREDALATVVSGLVLICLLVMPDCHPVVVVQSGNVRTLPARQHERAKPWHPVDTGLAVARMVATKLSHRTAVSPVTGHLGQSPGVLGSQAILDGGRNRKRLLSPLTVMSLLSMAVVPGK